jgi:hypothetical protein
MAIFVGGRIRGTSRVDSKPSLFPGLTDFRSPQIPLQKDFEFDPPKSPFKRGTLNSIPLNPPSKGGL